MPIFLLLVKKKTLVGFSLFVMLLIGSLGYSYLLRSKASSPIEAVALISTTPSTTPTLLPSPTYITTPTTKPSLSPTKQPKKLPPSPSKTPDSSVADVRFRTLPVGSKLPSNQECASRVRRSNWEPRAENNTANHTIPARGTDYDVIVWGPNTFGQAEPAGAFSQRVDGSFTGTTDEILQWAACKWGIDEDIVRAQAVKESWWRMSQLGDHTDNQDLCSIIGKNAPCDQSYGILQVKGSVHRKTYPASVLSTAFNADYTYAYWRSCYEGYVSWLRDQTDGAYDKGDVWGCLGFWYSGYWRDSGAELYIGQVKDILSQKRWAKPDF